MDWLCPLSVNSLPTSSGTNLLKDQMNQDTGPYATSYQTVNKICPCRKVSFNPQRIGTLRVHTPSKVLEPAQQMLEVPGSQTQTQGLHVCKSCLLWGPMYVDRAYFGLFGAKPQGDWTPNPKAEPAPKTCGR